MIQLTRRDEAMLEWLQIVRMADTEAIRWALPAVPGGGVAEPVHIRQAQHWIARMVEIGWVERDRLTLNANTIAWPSRLASGRRGPNLFAQTLRHELAVALVSAHYLGQGYTWTRDRRPASLADHQGDGVATCGDQVELIEVELTPKLPTRYRSIMNNHARRLESGEVTQITYLCTADAERTVAREANRHLFRDHRPQLTTAAVFDRHGHLKTPPAPHMQRGKP